MKSFVDTLEDRLQSAWQRTDELFEIISPQALWAKPIVWRHPFIFYLGHLPAFAWNQICWGLFKRPSVNPYFDDIFSRGIDPDVDTGECHSHPETPDAWPEVAEIVYYRERVREALLESLDGLRLKIAKGDGKSTASRFVMVLEHELMHQETLLYMVQELRHDLKRRPVGVPEYCFTKGASNGDLRVAPGRAALGASSNRLPFGWDNEFPQQIVEVPAFRIESTPVTNLKFLEFVEGGVYEDNKYWTPEDWSWKTTASARHPNFWLKQDGEWFYRTAFDLLPLAKVYDWPVYVSLAEANAYARWKGKRLPTEAEFTRAAWSSPDGQEHPFPWGEDEPSPLYGNFNFVHWSPVPVGSSPKGASPWGVHELVGNGWEWTKTPFAPFPGFEPQESYSDYSADFFDGKHYVLKGASWATARELLRPSFRNWYQAHYPYVFAKFRCVSEV